MGCQCEKTHCEILAFQLKSQVLKMITLPGNMCSWWEIIGVESITFCIIINSEIVGAAAPTISEVNNKSDSK